MHDLCRQWSHLVLPTALQDCPSGVYESFNSEELAFSSAGLARCQLRSVQLVAIVLRVLQFLDLQRRAR